MSKGIYRVYPNTYIVLVAPSGKCRKSGTIRTGISVLNHFDDINVIADKTTPEALLEALMLGNVEYDQDDDSIAGGGNANGNKDNSINVKIDSTGFIRSSEMSTFLNKNSYSSGMITILTDLFDCPDAFKYTTRNKRPIILDNVYVNMLAATTPEWLATNLPEEAFEGGFMSRVIWVVKHWRDRVIALEDEPDPDDLKKLIKMLKYIKKEHKGPMIFSSEAKDWYVKWYERNSMMASDSEKMSGFNERLPDTMIKIAMLIQASEQPGKLVLELGYLKQSEKIMRWVLDKMFRAFDATDLSRLGQLRRRINDIVDHYGEITQREILRKVGGRLDYKGQLNEAKELMVESGDVIVETRSPVAEGKKTGRPKIIWRRPLQSEL
jgi:hypothetical protein